jgi:hypothetical protein
MLKDDSRSRLYTGFLPSLVDVSLFIYDMTLSAEQKSGIYSRVCNNLGKPDYLISLIPRVYPWAIEFPMLLTRMEFPELTKRYINAGCPVPPIAKIIKDLSNVSFNFKMPVLKRYYDYRRFVPEQYFSYKSSLSAALSSYRYYALDEYPDVYNFVTPVF